MKRSVLTAAVVSATLASLAVFASQAARQPLFAPGQARAALASDASYRALSGDRATVGIELVQADAAQIAADSDNLQLSVGKRPLFARRTDFVQNPDGTSTWIGSLGKDPGLFGRLGGAFGSEISDDPRNSVIIVRNGDKLTGTLRVDGELYALRPLKSGGHAIARIDESKMPADHPADYAAMLRASVQPRLPAQPEGEVGIQAATVVRVMVVATQSAANASGDIAGLVNLAVVETNEGYANSGVNVSLQLAGRYTTSYVESGNFNTDLSRFRGTTDGYMDNYHTTRNSIAADLAVLIINNSQYCGLGYLNASATSAFTAVHYSCATGYYSFGHEIGHNFGAHHDPANGTNTAYAYGHGYQSPTKAWRTIMAYNCSPSCRRINYWSNPARTYGGQVMGTTSTHNNTRVHNQRAATVAGFR